MAALEAGRRAERRSRIELPILAVTTWMEQTAPLGSMEGKGHAMKALKGIAMILLALVAMALPDLSRECQRPLARKARG